jgi:Flp pilus assembly protein TadG
MLRKPQRKAAVAVETAMVISMVLLFFFAVFEYGRYLMVLQIVSNAAREGARFGAVHTYNMGTPDVVNVVQSKLTGVSNQLGTVTITVTGVVLVPPSGSGETVGQVLPNQTGPPLVYGWTTAGTSDGVSVQVQGTYTPILPTFLQMGVSIPVNVTCVMYSEGN